MGERLMVIALAHELFHAYQDDIGASATQDRLTTETQASYFQNYITSVMGYGAMRTDYTGLGENLFPSSEATYNQKNEKITNLVVSRNFPSKTVVTYGDGHSDGSYRTLTILGPDQGYKVSYDKSYTVDGKVVQQSMKKSNEPKIAKE